jgi:hypothetical protein
MLAVNLTGTPLSVANVMAKTDRSEEAARARFAAGNPQGRIVMV